MKSNKLISFVVHAIFAGIMLMFALPAIAQNNNSDVGGDIRVVSRDTTYYKAPTVTKIQRDSI